MSASTKPTGGPAFPLATHGGNVVKGMDLRDWFAGQALQGIAASALFSEWTAAEIARCAYTQADAMIAERGKP